MNPTPLSELTTTGVGGVATHLVTAATNDELVTAVREAVDAGEPWCILAGGSNSIFSDEGFDGTVILVRTTGIERQPASAESAETLVRVAAGENWDDFVVFTVEQGLAGVEALSGIPGSVGASPIQNIGAYGQDVSGSIRSVEFYDADAGQIVQLTNTELELGYRSSALKTGYRNGIYRVARPGAVLSVTFALNSNADGLSEPVAYGQLADKLGVQVGERAGLAAVREAVLELRASKGMVYSSTDLDSHSTGSFFMNPVVSATFAKSLPDDAPQWPAGELNQIELVKLSAAWLIEHAGIKKGFSLPGSRAAISSKHSLAITNRGGASSEDVAQLARFVLQRVQSEAGVNLLPEPVLYGIEL